MSSATSVPQTAASPRFESVLGQGAMVNWITVASEDVPVYEDWYNFQHLPERVSTPGFLRARRFVAVDQPYPGNVDYLTVYETEDPTVLASPEYLRRLDNPTDLTRRVVALFRQFRRAVCATTVVAGEGSSGRVLAIELEPSSDISSLRSALRDQIFPAAIAAHQMHGGSLYEPDAQISAAKDNTKEGRSSSQEQAEALLVLVELQTGVDSEELAAHVTATLADQGAARAAGPPRTFDLLFELRSR